jgi:hypothetical protein
MYTNSRLVSRTASRANWRTAIVVAIALLACPTVAPRAGDIYKSVDAEGHVVYSDRLDTSMAQQAPVELQDSDPVGDIAQDAPQSPPPLPDDEQPSCPDEGYLWTPGYWAWNAAGYYWTPGAWVQPPRVDVLWTPGYWQYVDAVYVFHRGYWAEHIGYYGGINYGFGYFGTGFVGGRWINHSFVYNRSASHVDARRIHHTYSESVDAGINRVSYNGGPGGTRSLMTAGEKALATQQHFPATAAQRQNSARAARTPALMPHMPVSVYHYEPGTDHRAVDAAPRPALLNAPATARSHATAPSSAGRQHELTRAPATSRASVQPSIASPGKPASTRPASSKALSTVPYPKS